MSAAMKRFIERKLKEDTPLSEIKKDLREKGYDADEINRAVRAAISGVDTEFSARIQIGILIIGVALAIGVAIYFTAYKTSQEEEIEYTTFSTATGEYKIPTDFITYTEMCAPFKNFNDVNESISCLQAIEKAVAAFDGKVVSVNRTFVVFPSAPTAPPQSVWLLKIIMDGKTPLPDGRTPSEIDVIVNRVTGEVREYRVVA